MISNGYGSVLACGTPLGRQRTFGSFSILFAMRASNSFCAAGSIFEVWTLREGGLGLAPGGPQLSPSQMPERSGIPSACLGAGAVIFTLPSGKRGTFFFS